MIHYIITLTWTVILWQFYHYNFFHVNGCVMTVTTSANHSSVFHTIFPPAGNEVSFLTISDYFYQVDISPISLWSAPCFKLFETKAMWPLSQNAKPLRFPFEATMSASVQSKKWVETASTWIRLMCKLFFSLLLIVFFTNLKLVALDWWWHHHRCLSQWSALVLIIQVFQASLIASSWEVADFQRTEEGLGKKNQ